MCFWKVICSLGVFWRKCGVYEYCLEWWWLEFVGWVCVCWGGFRVGRGWMEVIFFRFCFG